MDIEKEILGPIDRTLAAVHVPDFIRSVEGSVWADLDESVQLGFRTPEEAQDTFLQWRAQYLGHSAMNGCADAPAVPKQQQQDIRRRMRRTPKS